MPKHIPLRSCIACRETKPKRELVRVVHTPEGPVEVDRTGKKNGRGAYFCPAQECWELGQKKKALNHAFKITVTPENWDELLRYARETLPEKKVPTRVPAQAVRRAKGAKSRGAATSPAAQVAAREG
jgi:predicted RNA-binding protein YlxR (DUF448 family)